MGKTGGYDRKVFDDQTIFDWLKERLWGRLTTKRVRRASIKHVHTFYS